MDYYRLKDMRKAAEALGNDLKGTTRNFKRETFKLLRCKPITQDCGYAIYEKSVTGLVVLAALFHTSGPGFKRVVLRDGHIAAFDKLKELRYEVEESNGIINEVRNKQEEAKHDIRNT